VRWKFLHIFHDRLGKLRVQFRRKGYNSVMLPTPVGGPEFCLAYHAALAGQPLVAAIPIGSTRRDKGSLSDVIAAYYAKSAIWKGLHDGTKRGHRNVLERFRNDCGRLPIAGIDRQFISAQLAEAPSPHAGKNWLKAVRSLLEYAKDVGLISENPTVGFKVKLPKSDGFRMWEEEHIALFEAHHPVGTMARLAFDLFLYTGQRREDVVLLGPQNIAGGSIRLKQIKTGNEVENKMIGPLLVSIAATPVSLKAKRNGVGTFLYTSRDAKAYSENGLTHDFKLWVEAVPGLPRDLTPHGLRKAFCRRLAEMGLSEHDIACCSGHESLNELRRYTKKYRRKAGADRAMTALERKLAEAIA
jgi:integrase